MGATASNASGNTARADHERPGYGTGNGQTVNGDALSWRDCDGDIVKDCIGAVNKAGDGISFAEGSRGDWISVTILADGDRPRWVARSIEEAHTHLTDIINAARRRGR